MLVVWTGGGENEECRLGVDGLNVLRGHILNAMAFCLCWYTLR